MYDYLNDFEAFYKHWTAIHYRIAYLNPPADCNQAVFSLESAQRTHAAFYACFVNILRHYSNNVDYISLVSEDKRLFAPLADVAKRHYQAGTKLGYLLSGLNMSFECFCKVTLESQISDHEKAISVENLRKIHAAYTVLSAEQWMETDSTHYRKELDEKYAQLEHLENRFTKHIDMRRSSIAFIDSAGAVIRLNKAARTLFGLDPARQKYYIMDILDYHFMSFESFVRHYSNDKHRPVRLMNGEKFLMSMTPLLHKDGVPCEYVIVLRQARNAELAAQITKNDNGDNDELLLKKLTYTEAQICKMIYEGASSKHIAELLNISIETVKTHRKNIRKKLNLRESGLNMYSYIKNRPT